MTMTIEKELLLYSIDRDDIIKLLKPKSNSLKDKLSYLKSSLYYECIHFFNCLMFKYTNESIFIPCLFPLILYCLRVGIFIQLILN